MRRIVLGLAVLAMVVMAGSASAITTDGDWSDWFSYAGAPSSDNWDQAAAAGSLLNSRIRAVADEEGPTPGGGAQDYDIEQIFYYYEDAGLGLTGGTLHIGMVTGFPAAGHAPYFAGDLFVGLGNSGGLELGIVVAKDAGRVGLYENAYLGSANNHLVPSPGPFIASAPWRMDERDLAGGVNGGVGEGELTNVTGLLSPTVRWGGDGMDETTLGAASARHYFLEVALAIDGGAEEQITHLTNGGLSLHWTMGCGNDVITFTDPVPLAPIPEPTTMVLLGMGVLGMALRARRPVC